MTTNSSGPLDRFVHGRAATLCAFAWGFAEATLFFFVPDVLLTLIACRSLRASLKATTAAILGALLGGIVMYGLASVSPETARSWLVHVPAIHPPLLQRVESQFAACGLEALVLGPTLGIPYKIYAVEWGARHGNFPMFVLLSVPARGIRFVLAALLASGLARLLAPWTRRRAQIEIALLALVWVGFYLFYFVRFGW